MISLRTSPEDILQIQIDQSTAKVLTDFYQAEEKKAAHDTLTDDVLRKKFALGNLYRALLSFSQTGNIEDEIQAAIPGSSRFSIESHKVSEIFADALSSHGRLAESIAFFSAGHFKNPELVAFGIKSLEFLKGRRA